jgi:type I restriction enzyme S subunit
MHSRSKFSARASALFFPISFVTLAVEVARLNHVIVQERDPSNALAHQGRGDVGNKATGTDAQHAGFGVPFLVKASDLALPIFGSRHGPLAEQWRITSKLGAVLAKLQDSQNRLENIPRIVQRFREAVLNAAVTGKLTINWRNKNDEMETAAAELRSFGTASVARRFHTRELESTEGNEGLIDKVPVEWVTPSLEDLFRFIDYRGRTPKKARSGKRLISAKNIKMGYISEEPVEYVSNEFYKTWMTRGIPKKGDIFFVTEGHTMGFTALNNRTDEFALSQRTITLQPWQPIETTCFFYFIMSPIFQELVRLNATGSAAVGIKAARFRGLPIPFPSRAERQEIVRRVQSLFALADQIEARYSKVKAQVDRLTHPILSKAFQGELVRTEAELAAAEGRDYESAEELLKRIAYQRDSAVGSLTQSTRRSAIKEWLR